MSALTYCLKQEAAAIDATAERLDSQQVETALKLLQDCQQRHGKLVVSGVGKSGIVARKIAATFSSIGLTGVFLNPVDALHGDLGIVSGEDVALLLSNSGETQELLAILPHLKKRGTSLIGLVGRFDSSLARGCDIVLDGSVDREVCPLNLAPTASTAVAMAIGDALAVVWMERAGVSPADFAINHPAGSLGRQLTLTVGDLMVPVTELKALHPDASLTEVMAHLTQGSPFRGSLGACWVHAAGEPTRLAGLITDGDLRRALQQFDTEGWSKVTAGQMATRDPITVLPDTLAIDALKLMESNRRKSISILPVVDSEQNGGFLGFLRLHDLIRAGFCSGDV